SAKQPACSRSTMVIFSVVHHRINGFNSATPCLPCSPRRSRAASDVPWKGAEQVSVAARNGSIAFQPRARLLKLIGEELISDEVVAISELVKNAHDADAHRVTIAFEGVTGPDGSISIRDDGHGMDVETLLGRWMEPAASTKVGKGRQITRLGRRVLGEKG